MERLNDWEYIGDARNVYQRDQSSGTILIAFGFEKQWNKMYFDKEGERMILNFLR